jgi:hypothetical protein
MNKTIRRAIVSGLLIMFAFGHFIHAQQHQSKTWVNPNGEKFIVDVNTGFTGIDKSGKVINIFTTAQLIEVCEEIDGQAAPQDTAKIMAEPCEIWAELHPKTQI